MGWNWWDDWKCETTYKRLANKIQVPAHGLRGTGAQIERGLLPKIELHITPLSLFLMKPYTIVLEHQTGMEETQGISMDKQKLTMIEN